jgi:hypothetical protein
MHRIVFENMDNILHIYADTDTTVPGKGKERKEGRREGV